MPLMTGTVDQAASFIQSCLYPPVGLRSFGPARAPLYAGADYYPGIDGQILKFAMIETQAGLDNLEQILQLEHLDGVYIGPNDLALALGCQPKAESDEHKVIEAVRQICALATKHGKFAGMHTSGGEAAARRVSEGFHFVTPGNDVALLSSAAKAAVATVRGAKPGAPSATGY